MRCAVFVCLAVALLGAGVAGAGAGEGVEGVLRLPAGAPAAGFSLSVVGQGGAVTTDAQGRFRLPAALRLPLILVATAPGGEVYAPIEIRADEVAAPLDLRLEPAATETVSVLSGVAPTISASPGAATTTLTRADLDGRKPRHVAEALLGTPGASRSEGAGPDAVPVLRGLGGGRTMILLDGARVTAERRAGPSAGFLDPSSLASVEVARGPGSVAYGSDAFGGVISLRYPDPQPGAWNGRAQGFAGFGGVPEAGLGVSASGSFASGALLVQAHARDAGEQEAGGGEEIFNSSAEDRGAHLRFVRAFAAGSVRGSLAADEVRDMGKPQADSRITRAFYPLESSRRLTAGFLWDPREHWDLLEARLLASSYRIVTDRDRFATPSVARRREASDVDARDGSLRFEASRGVAGGRLHLGVESAGRFGLRAENEILDYDAAGQPAPRRRDTAVEDAWLLDHGLFAVWSKALGERISISLGGRGDAVRSENRGGFFGDRQRDDSAGSGHAAITTRLGDAAVATLQASRGFRSPRLSDLYFRGVSGRGFIVGNPELESERSLQFDGGLRWQRGSRGVSVAAYDYRIENLIERFRSGGDFRFRNRGVVTLRGVEVEAGFDIGPRLRWELAASASRGEDQEGQAIDGIPPHGGWSTWRWQGDRVSLYGRWSAFAREKRPGPNEVERPGFSTLDLGGSYRFPTRLEVLVHARNVLDRRLRASADNVAGLASGRTLNAALQVSF